MTHKYDQYGISPKQFLLEVTWDTSVDLLLRIDAAFKASTMIEHGDFCEPDLSYRIEELRLQ